jgi:peptidoglycan/LPS O-acetylase OafA/YrhL
MDYPAQPDLTEPRANRASATKAPQMRREGSVETLTPRPKRSGFFQTITFWLAGQLEETKPKGAIATLDGVRAIACLTVVAYHISLASRDLHLWLIDSNPFVSSVLLSGGAGVTLFFVLSGLLLFLPYARALLSDQPWPGTRLFYLRRALRIIPGYYFSLFILVLLTQPQYLEPQRWKAFILFPLFLMDSSAATFRQLNGPYWTLAIEWQFYLLLPWIALAIYGVARHVRLERRGWMVVGCLLVMMGWGVFSRFFGSYYLANPTQTFLVPREVFHVVLFFTYGMDGKYLEDFAVGMLLGLGYTVLSSPTGSAKWGRYLKWGSPWLWVSGLLLLFFTATQQYSFQYHYVWSALPGLFTLPGWLLELGFAVGFGLCIAAVLFGSPWLGKPFAWTPLRWIGLISYSMYIWHLPLLGTFIHHIAPSLRGLPAFVVYGSFWVWVAVVILPFSFALYVLIEKPGMRLSDRFRSQARARHGQARITKQLATQLD